MKYTRIREVKAPVHEHKQDAGIDFFLPEVTEEYVEEVGRLNTNLISYSTKDTLSDFDMDEEDGFTPRVGYSVEDNTLLLLPNALYKIPLGVKIEVPWNSALIAKEKSGVSVKQTLGIVGGVIDSGYEGELILLVQNKSREKELVLKGGQKLAQFILIPVITPTISLEEVDLPEIHRNSSSRGEGGFGSTGA